MQPDRQASTAANRRERIYAAHPFGMPVKFARRWLEDRRPVCAKRPTTEPLANGWASAEGNDAGDGPAMPGHDFHIRPGRSQFERVVYDGYVKLGTYHTQQEALAFMDGYARGVRDASE